MDKVKEMLSELHSVCADPRAQLDAALARGRKAVGVLPYFCPEELVYAAGMLPFGLWGAEMQTSLSGRYYPAFTCRSRYCCNCVINVHAKYDTTFSLYMEEYMYVRTKWLSHSPATATLIIFKYLLLFIFCYLEDYLGSIITLLEGSWPSLLVIILLSLCSVA